MRTSPAVGFTTKQTHGAFFLRLLGGFSLVSDAGPVQLPASSQRVLAFLSVVMRPLTRATIAGTLWPETPDAQASANLRSALWRLAEHRPWLVVERGQQVQLAEDVDVDIRRATSVGRRILAAIVTEEDDIQVDLFASDLLPDWYDEWLDVERERFRQLRLHVLETLSARFLSLRRFGDAVEAALLAISSEPLRETAQRALIEAYLAEGNRADALRQYKSYRQLLREELDLEPPPDMRDTIQELRTVPMSEAG